MCSVTFWPTPRGYLLGMNRDENLRRPAGLPPARFVVDGRNVVHPREPGGGTWISLNDGGVSFALVNWYAIEARAPQPAVSRGSVVIAVRDCLSPESAADRLAQLPLIRMNSFRLLGLFPRQQSVCEWRWNLETLSSQYHPWSSQQWCSSGCDEPTAQRIRGAVFASSRKEPDAGTIPWLRRLHASHYPACGPFSTCMHRTDAATVSYTENEVGDNLIVTRHHVGPACRARSLTSDEIHFPAPDLVPARQNEKNPASQVENRSWKMRN